MGEDNADAQGRDGWLRPYLEARFGSLEAAIKDLRGDYANVGGRLDKLEDARERGKGARSVWLTVAEWARYLLTALAGAIGGHLWGHG